MAQGGGGGGGGGASSRHNTERGKMTITCPGCVAKPRLGNYQLEKALGAGNFAVVRLAEHCITGTKVAMKIIDKSKLCREDLSRLFREVQIMKLLDHPNIIQFYQVVENYQYIHLVSSYAENGELFEHVTREGKLSESEARKYFAQICSAIGYCHEKGVVHRDLKIENVLLDCNNNVKIADFGFSNYFKLPRLLETFCGSPQYAAPEIFSGKCYNGMKTDIWSLGIILYVMVTGGLPFDGDNIAQVRKSVLSGKFRVPYFVSHECEALIRSMLCLEPEKRAQMSDIRSHPWMRSDPSLTKSDGDSSQPVALNPNILNLMENIGIPTSKVIESYNSFLFNDFTAIYKLLDSQLQTKGCIDINPIKDWLRQGATPGCSTHCPNRSSGPAPPSSSSHKPAPAGPPRSSRKTSTSKQGLDKVLHNAKNRALSAIFHKSDDPASRTRAGKMKEMKHKNSPLISSLISPRVILDGPQSPKFFSRNVFGFTRHSSSKNNISQQLPQAPHSAR